MLAYYDVVWVVRIKVAFLNPFVLNMLVSFTPSTLSNSYVAFLNPFVLNMLEVEEKRVVAGEDGVAFLNPFVLNMLVQTAVLIREEQRRCCIP